MDRDYNDFEVAASPTKGVKQESAGGGGPQQGSLPLIVYIFRIIDSNRAHAVVVLRCHLAQVDSIEPVRCSVKSRADLFFRLAHADGDFDKSVGDGLVGAELHQLGRHRDAELLSHAGDLVEVGLGAEG